MQVGDVVQVRNGPHGGMTGTIVEISERTVKRRKKDRPRQIPVAKIRTRLKRYFQETIPNIKPWP